jgi:putative SOS response-associated peptidase YedK
MDPRRRAKSESPPEGVKLYRLTLDQPARNTQPRYNISLTTTIDTVVSSEGKRALVPMRWGLIPHWWSKPLKDMRLATFNARAESIATKPMFRDSFERR